MTQTLLIFEHRSSISAHHSIRALYWSRFNTMYNLIRDARNTTRFQHEVKDVNFWTFLETHHPSENFKTQIDRERMAMYHLNETQILQKDLYKDSLITHFDNNVEYAHQFLKLEKMLLTDIVRASPQSMLLRDTFNSYNRKSLGYIQQVALLDIRNLSNTSDRFKQFGFRYSTPLTLIFTALLPIQWTWAQIVPMTC